MPVYMIHSDKPLVRGNGVKVAHYIGHAEEETLWQRLSEHATLNRKNPAIIAAFHRRDSVLRLVRVWPEGGRALERHLKQKGHYKSRCPICNDKRSKRDFPTLTAMSALTLELWRRLTARPARSTVDRSLLGAALYKGGRSHPTLRPVFSTYSGSDPARSKAKNGGSVSSASAQTNGSAEGSAGTKPSSSSTGTTPPDNTGSHP